jgi:hypothetical protein
MIQLIQLKKELSMKLFSQRKGLKPVKSVMQVDSMDDDLRNGLWNALTVYYWSKVESDSYGRKRLSCSATLHSFIILPKNWTVVFSG